MVTTSSSSVNAMPSRIDSPLKNSRYLRCSGSTPHSQKVLALLSSDLRYHQKQAKPTTPRYRATKNVQAVTESEMTFPPDTQLMATYMTPEMTANEVVEKV